MQNRVTQLLLAIIALLLLVIAIQGDRPAAIPSPLSPKNDGRSANLTPTRPPEYEMVTNLVSSLLIAPSTAEFENISIFDAPTKTALGRVHAQNIFGARITDSFELYFNRLNTNHPEKEWLAVEFFGDLPGAKPEMAIWKVSRYQFLQREAYLSNLHQQYPTVRNNDGTY